MIRIAGFCTILFASFFAVEAQSKASLVPGSFADVSNAKTSAPETMTLTVQAGTPLQVALDHEIRVKKKGQPIQGHLMQPVYAFDQLVLPVGTQVQGHITKIGSPGGKVLTLSILNVDFTPARPIQISFDELVLADRTRLPMQATVVPGSGQLIRMVDATAAQSGSKKGGLSRKIDEAKQQWHEAFKELEQPGKMIRAVRVAIAQLPVHPQYIDAGTLYFAELQKPLDFGSKAVDERALQSVGTLPPPGSVVSASLITPLDSGTTKHGAAVQAVVSKPLYDGDRLILPQGTLLNGSVLHVQPARRLKHNGQLRVAFHELVLPGGSSFRVDTTLKGIQASESDNASLDPEGGAKASNPSTRYVTTGLAVSLAMVGSGGKNDVGEAGPISGGAVAFRLVGIAVGFAVRDHTIGILMSAYGGSRSIYTNFFGHGRNISFPKDTAMEIGLGGPTTETPMQTFP